MEWLECIRRSIDLMEAHIMENYDIRQIARELGISDMYLQKGFKLMTGYTMTEYLRDRRLYLGALDVIQGKEKIIDIAYKYGYETPESFTKAFTRFHGMAPVQLRKDASRIKVFLPLKIKISIQGGNEMDYVVEKLTSFKVIGFQHIVTLEEAYKKIPKIWDEFCEKYMTPLIHKEKTQGETEEMISQCHIGEYGICIDDIGNGRFRYMIAGLYTGGKVPDGMTTYEFPEMSWAKFSCRGPMPGALQSVNTKLFNEWLPGNPDYEIAMGANIEWYKQGDTNSPDYESGIWIPVKRK